MRKMHRKKTTETNNKMLKFTSGSDAETENFAKNFAKDIRCGDVITLKGRLGAGKTVFCKGLAKGLGIKEEITSPTFTIMNIYNGERNLCHIDAYRLKSGEEAFGAGLCDYIGNKDYVCLIEWAENIASVLPDNVISVSIQYLGENSREISVNDK